MSCASPPGIDGLWHLSGLLDPLCGEALATISTRSTNPIPPAPGPGPGTGTVAGNDGQHDTYRRSPAQRRHDALDTALRRLLDSGHTPVQQGVKPHIVALIDIATLAGADAAATRTPRLSFTGQVAPGCVRRLAQQAKVTAVAAMGPWRAAGVGRTQRSLPGWLRPVLAAQHATAAAPTATAPSPGPKPTTSPPGPTAAIPTSTP